ncbi:MAG: UDP-2,4-diacetamido-2,4,6-trideoxy-beta-L-altropyranose hydrolase [Alphaproteobacteria bacterium]|nr:UDP-2,4-diacetamido-2,4,6-trideoxy-beta-L-altropyranose hydrolase [Alphaproteobacteria bacterium]
MSMVRPHKKAIFRCDASSKIGGGHVMRCLTLADELSKNGWKCAFSSNPDAPVIIPALKNYQLIAPDALGDLSDRADLLVIDHYGLDHEYEKQCRKWADKILVIDDFANRTHDCDILIDQTYGRSRLDYTSLTPDHCKILTGTKYALLRQQFRDARERSLARRLNDFSIKRVLISLGMMNMHNINLKALQALKLFEDIRVQIDVVLSSSASFMDELKNEIAKINKTGFHKVTLHTNIENMPTIMAQANITIGAGGSTSWERCTLGLPAIVIELANNQRKISKELAEAGAIINMGWHENVTAQNIADTLSALSSNPDRLIQISQNAAKICDGSGVERVIKEIQNA